MWYKLKYGATRQERASNMAHNIQPFGERLPRVREVDLHRFVRPSCCYLSEVSKKSGTSMIWCKSQKWFDTRKLYKVTFRKRLRSGTGTATAQNCTCEDWIYRGIKCKHMLCVEMVNP